MLPTLLCLIAICDTPASLGQLTAEPIDPSFDTAAGTHYQMYGLLRLMADGSQTLSYGLIWPTAPMPDYGDWSMIRSSTEVKDEVTPKHIYLGGDGIWFFGKQVPLKHRIFVLTFERTLEPVKLSKEELAKLNQKPPEKYPELKFWREKVEPIVDLQYKKGRAWVAEESRKARRAQVPP